MKTILFMTEANNYMSLSIKERLENAAYNVITVAADIDAVNQVKEPLDGILIFANDKLSSQQQSLAFLKDRAVMEDIPIFMVGDTEDIKTVNTIIPKNLIQQEFVRPVNVNNMLESIDNFIRQYNIKLKKKILVVDDSGTELRKAKEWLENKYNVFLANSAAMAIKYLALNRPDLVLLDYEMPLCNGQQIMEMIRAETEFSDIPVIFLTNTGNKDVVMKIKELKPEGYLLKSMEPSQIVKSVDAYFEKKKENEIKHFSNSQSVFQRR